MLPRDGGTGRYHCGILHGVCWHGRASLDTTPLCHLAGMCGGKQAWQLLRPESSGGCTAPLPPSVARAGEPKHSPALNRNTHKDRPFSAVLLKPGVHVVKTLS